jgi:hypothetical protein
MGLNHDIFDHRTYVTEFRQQHQLFLLRACDQYRTIKDALTPNEQDFILTRLRMMVSDIQQWRQKEQEIKTIIIRL